MFRVKASVLLVVLSLTPVFEYTEVEGRNGVSLIEQSRNAFSEHPESAEAALKYAQSLVLAGENEEAARISSVARNLLLERLEVQGPSAKLYYDLSLVSRIQGRLYLARNYLKKSLEDDSKYVPSILGLADLEVVRGKLDEAIALLRRATSEVSDTGVTEALGTLLVEKELYLEATVVFESLLESFDEKDSYIQVLLSLYAKTGGADKATVLLDELTKAGKISELDKLVHLSEIYFAVGDLETIRPVISKIRRLAPDHPATKSLLLRFNMARAKAAEVEGLDSRALLFLNRALELDPSNSDVLYATGLLHARMGSFKKAEEFFRLLLRNPPDRPEVFVHAAFVFYATGNMEAAMGTLKLSAEIAKENDDEEDYLIFVAAREKILNTVDPSTIFDELKSL